MVVAHARSYPPFPGLDPTPSSPWIYVSKIGGVGPKRPIGDQAAYLIVEKLFLLTSCWPSDHHHYSTLACSMCSVGAAACYGRGAGRIGTSAFSFQRHGNVHAVKDTNIH